MNKLKKKFKKDKNIIIGAIHFPPLLGYTDFPGFKITLNNALEDLIALEKGGADGIIFENNYDIPHKTFVDSSVVASMAFLGEKIKSNTKLPLGISVLWNDYQTALSIAKILDLQFIRIPVFIDEVKTNYGIIKGEAKKIINYRKLIKAEKVALFTDIHVKHSELLSKNDIIASAKLAIENNSDAIIITGKWTGQQPDLKELKSIRNSIGQFPILIGSGINKDNIHSLFEYANGAIVSTSLKEGKTDKKEINIKSYAQRISIKKVQSLIQVK
ncbi:BtpA/SgcQ family protein [Patescibacteria group bacterium]